MQCLVCGGEVQVTEIPIKRRGIKCPSCGEYDVSGTVYETGMLQKLDRAHWLIRGWCIRGGLLP